MTPTPPVPAESAAAEAMPAPEEPRALDASVAHCRRITRSRAGNFYHGLKLTPEPKRSAMYAVYAYMRACDDLVDEAEDAAREQVEAFRRRTERVLAGEATPEELAAPSIWPAFRWAVRTYGIDRSALHAMLDGQLEDLNGGVYRSFDALHGYCYRVAGTVGLVCLDVWGYEGGEATRALAVKRGLALQLTNILRDLAEDLHAGRIYLPRDELEKFDCDLESAVRHGPGRGFDELLGFQIERARRYYEASDELEARIPADCRPTSWAIMRLYRRLLEKIAAEPRRVLRERVRLSGWEKAAIAARAVAKRFSSGGLGNRGRNA